MGLSFNLILVRLSGTSPIQPSTRLQTCMPDERPSFPSTEPCSSGPAWAPGLSPSVACGDTLPSLQPRLFLHTDEPSSDCLTPQCAPAGRTALHDEVSVSMRTGVCTKKVCKLPEWDAPLENPRLGLCPSSAAASGRSVVSPGQRGLLLMSCIHVIFCIVKQQALQKLYHFLPQLLGGFFLWMELQL